MKKSQKVQRSGDQTLAMGLLALSGAFAAVFIVSICVVGQHVRLIGSLGSPNSFAALPSALLALYVWLNSPRPVHRYRYGVLAILAVLVTGFVIWLYGMTGAGNALVQG